MVTLSDLNSTYSFLRNCTSKWKADTKKKDNNRCILSGAKNNLQVHHLNKSFIEICEETFTQTNLPFKKNTSDYTEKELEQLAHTCLELHYKYGLGCTLSAPLHKTFHHNYGVTGYTIEDFKEFKRRYKANVRESKRRK